MLILMLSVRWAAVILSWVRVVTHFIRPMCSDFHFILGSLCLYLLANCHTKTILWLEGTQPVSYLYHVHVTWIPACIFIHNLFDLVTAQISFKTRLLLVFHKLAVLHDHTMGNASFRILLEPMTAHFFPLIKRVSLERRRWQILRRVDLSWGQRRFECGCWVASVAASALRWTACVVTLAKVWLERGTATAAWLRRLRAVSFFGDDRYMSLILRLLGFQLERLIVSGRLVVFVVSEFNIANITALAYSIASFAPLWRHYSMEEGWVFWFLRFRGRDRVVSWRALVYKNVILALQLLDMDLFM